MKTLKRFVAVLAVAATSVTAFSVHAAAGFYQAIYSGSDASGGDPMSDGIVIDAAGLTFAGNSYTYGGTTYKVGGNTTAAYKAYWKMTAGTTYRFVKNYDDSGRITITDPSGTAKEVLHSTGYNDLKYATYTPTATGWHTIDLRVGNGSGGVGPRTSPFNDNAKLGAGLAWTTDPSATDCTDANYTKWNRFENKAGENAVFRVSLSSISATATYDAANVRANVSITLKELASATARVTVDYPTAEGEETLVVAESAAASATPLTAEVPLVSGATSKLVVRVEMGDDEETIDLFAYAGELAIAKGEDADINLGKKGSFTVTRGDSAAATAQPLTVKYAVSGGTAVAGTDYAELSGEVTIPAGAASATIAVTPKTNMEASGAKTLALALAAGVYAISSEAATATISLSPVTSTWTYDTAAGTISDEDWVLNVETDSSVAGGLKVKSVNTKITDGTVLNLAKPILNADTSDKTAYAVVVVKSEAFKGRTDITELYLAEGFYEFAYRAFMDCTSLGKVSPLLPDSVKTLGEAAFCNCPIEGDFRLGFGTESVSVNTYAHFKNHRFTTITFGPNAKTVGENMFNCDKKNTTLKQVTLHDGVTTWKAAPFYNSSALTNITPCLPKGLTSISQHNCLSSLSACSGTVEFATGESSYGVEMETLMSGSAFDTVVFGVKFNGKFRKYNHFTSMPNLRHFRFLGDANLDFKPQDSWNSFFDDKPYQLIVHVPADNATWQAVLADTAQVTPWASLSDEIKAKFTQYFPNERKPKGLIVTNWSTGAAAGTTKTLVNRWITDDASETTFFVQGNPENAGSPSIPYGTTKNPTYPVTCTLTAKAPCGATLYQTTGYTVQYLDENGDPVGEPVTSSALSYTYDGTGGYSVVLTWNFSPIGYKANIVVPAGDWSVTEVSTPDLEGGYYSPGSSATYTAVGEGFVRWFGDVGDADPTKRTITVTLDQAKTLKPYFPSSWELAADGKTLADGYWTLLVSGNADNLTVSAFTGDPLAILDLSKPIVGGGAVVAVGNTAFKTAGAALEELYLPNTLATIGQQAFADCTALRKVSPLLPDSVSYIGQQAFWQCPIEGDFRLGFGPSSVGVGGSGHFKNHRLTTITFGPNAKTLGEHMFSTDNNTTLKQVTLHDGVTTWNAAPFYNCIALTNITPCFPKGLAGIGQYASLATLSACSGTVEIAMGENSYNINNVQSLMSGSGFDTVVFGKNFGGVFTYYNHFTGMPNLRHFYFLGDANLDFQPQNTWNTFFDDKPYQLIVHVPNPTKNASWKAVLEDPTQVTPWGQLDGETKAKFYEYFPNEKRPKGLIIANWSSNGAEGTTKTLVNRWITCDSLPGFSLIVR